MPFDDLNVSGRNGDDLQKVEKNWDIIASSFSLSREQFYTIEQVHGARIVVLDGIRSDSRRFGDHACDGIVSNRRGLALGIQTADCVPILFHDPVMHIIGAVHAGWRGTASGIAQRTIDVFIRRFSSKPTDIVAVIGPCIGACCYEVDNAVFNAMEGHQWTHAVFKRCEQANRWKLDLGAANMLQLRECGMPQENIAVAGLCTLCREDLFFSHRGTVGDTGRQLNFIMMC